MSNRPQRRIVLLGAGHAHLYVLKRAREFVQRGHAVTVVAPDNFWYSGLATGMLGGCYPPELDQVDIGALVTRSGGVLVRDRVVRVDPAGRIVHLATAAPLPYDVLSVTLGSEPPAIAGADQDRERIYSVKPVRRLWELRQHLEQCFKTAAATPYRIVVAGAGASGCEIAANIAQLAKNRNGRVSLSVLTADDEVLGQLPRAAVRSVVTALERRGIVFRCNARITQIMNGAAVLADGARLPFDVLVNATGLEPSSALRALGLPLDSRGGLIVNQYLRSIAAAEVHGAGDCISLQGRVLPRVGVYAIRAAPVLFDNLLAAAEGRPPRKFRPQRQYLLIMNLGDGTGLAVRGGWYWHGRAAFRLKDWIDRQFLREYRKKL